MFTKRATAVKVKLNELINSEFIKNEGEIGYSLINGVRVSRINIIATIVNKFVNNEKHSGTIVIDDGFDVINVRVWENEFHLIDNLVIGDLIKIIGRVRKYNDEIYLTPEIIKKVNPNWFALRFIEINNQASSNEQLISNKQLDEQSTLNNSDSINLKDNLFNFIKNKGNDGATIEELTSIAGDKKLCINALMELINDDLIFEPRAGRYKLL